MEKAIRGGQHDELFSLVAHHSLLLQRQQCGNERNHVGHSS
jgi:hypothetical protein